MSAFLYASLASGVATVYFAYRAWLEYQLQALEVKTVSASVAEEYKDL